MSSEVIKIEDESEGEEVTKPGTFKSYWNRVLEREKMADCALEKAIKARKANKIGHSEFKKAVASAKALNTMRAASVKYE